MVFFLLAIIGNMFSLCLCLMSLIVGHKGAENNPKHGVAAATSYLTDHRNGEHSIAKFKITITSHSQSLNDEY